MGRGKRRQRLVASDFCKSLSFYCSLLTAFPVNIANLFKFSIRFFAAFLAAKFLLVILGADTPGMLLGLSLFLVLLTYFFDLLDRHWQGALRRALQPAAIGWLVARMLIRMNVVEPPKERPPDPRRKEGEE